MRNNIYMGQFSQLYEEIDTDKVLTPARFSVHGLTKISCGSMLDGDFDCNLT